VGERVSEQVLDAVAPVRGGGWRAAERRGNPLRGELDIALERHRERHPRGRRAFDVAFAATVLVLGAPLFLLLLVAVALSSPGPVIYGQVRVGRRGRAFRCWKFRTMVVDADQVLADLLDGDPTLREEFSADHKLRNDPRVTRLGALLRRTSLDELPQFWNVLRGEMSIVGPRPIVWDEAHHYGPQLAAILTVRPGLTGVWQVSGRNALPYPARVALQAVTAGPRSLWGDLALVVRTVTLLFAWRSNGAW
jgi:lipopolysaccharide/colanic/teichoic acid biosynthesis glycosyltransferase